MADDIVIDKSIIYIDSDKGIYSDSSKYDFYIDIEPLKNVMYIKILDTNISIDVNGDGNAPKFSGRINNIDIKNLDPVYISLNNYKRIQTNILEINTNDPTTDPDNLLYDKTNKTRTQYLCYYFDEITLDKSKDYSGYNVISQGDNFGRMTFNSSKDVSSSGFDVYDPNVYVINPMEPLLNKFNVKLYNKNNIIINKIDTVGGVSGTNLDRFTMKIAVYYSRKKITMY